MIKHIQAGTLKLSFSDGGQRLDDLLGFASRENQKRGFLFVSKVLGKHIPVTPGAMRAIYDELADLCNIDDSAYVIGLAETATGLGAGVADSLAKKNPSCSVFYQHTTRHQLEQPVWFTLDEIHSHAVAHIMYQPNEVVVNGIMSAKHLILVDDEITTGRTLFLLASQLIARIPSIKEVLIVTLVNWLKPEDFRKFDDLEVPVKFIQLLKGKFAFTSDSRFNASLPDNVDDDICKAESRNDLGRTGLKMPYQLKSDKAFLNSYLNPPQRLVVVGTGEHLYYPFLVAEYLAEIVDVLFQSTTRSPILEGDAIKHKVCFATENSKVNFIYNLPQDREVLVITEGNRYCGMNRFISSLQEPVSSE